MLKQLQQSNKRALNHAKRSKNGGLIQKQMCVLSSCHNKSRKSKKKDISNNQSFRFDQKQNKKLKSSLHCEQFPLNSIKFRQNLQVHHRQSTFQNDISKISRTTPLKQTAINKSNAKQQQYSNNHRRSNIKYEDYVTALKRIFKTLDIFNRGRISQANINKWVPENALYFLGAVFQKIRQQRITLQEDEFIALCSAIYKESTLEDIAFFVEEVMGEIERGESMSINNSDLSNLRQSKVETKIKINQENHRDFQEICNLRNEQLPQNEKQPTLNSIFNKIDHLRQNQIIKQTGIVKNVVSQPKTKFENIKQEIKAKEGALYCYAMRRNGMLTSQKPIDHNSDRKEPIRKQNNFTFQEVNQRKIQYTQSQQSSLSKFDQILNQMKFDLKKEEKSIKGSLQGSKLKAESDRIDRLSNKLEDYIKMNVAKIQKSKIFTKEIPKDKKLLQFQK